MPELIQSDRQPAGPHRQLLAVMADLMIPAEGGLPSAADAEILSDLLGELTGQPTPVGTGLEALEAICTRHFGQAFVALEPAAQLEAVVLLRAVDPQFLQRFEAAVVTAYYRDARVQRALGLPGRSPWPEGNTVAPTDWSLLDPVRQRQPFYRNV